MSLYWKVKSYLEALFGDLNYKFKAFCANLRCKFRAFLHSYTTFLNKFKFYTSFKVALAKVKTIQAKQFAVNLICPMVPGV